MGGIVMISEQYLMLATVHIFLMPFMLLVKTKIANLQTLIALGNNISIPPNLSVNIAKQTDWLPKINAIAHNNYF
jgi:hypothetical protein